MVLYLKEKKKKIGQGGNGCKLAEGRFRLDMKEKLFMERVMRNKLSRGVVDALSLGQGQAG